MPRRKAAEADSDHGHALRPSTKRAHDDDSAASTSQEPTSVEPDAAADDTPPPAADGDAGTDAETVAIAVAQDPPPAPSTVTPRKRGRPPKAATTPRPGEATPTKTGEAFVSTPVRLAADRSARKKSARALIEKAVRDGADGADDDGDENLVREIYDDGDDDDDEGDEGDELDGDEDTDGQTPREDAPTPSKRPRPRQSRRKQASPTPPRDLPPHELYFVHNKPGRPKTSDNTLSSMAMLTHEEYFGVLREHRDRHADEVAFLEALHAESFPQWAFELAEGFSLCLYGLGSKRALLRSFAAHLRARDARRPVVVVNGYAHGANMRDILAVVAAAVDARHRVAAAAAPAMLHAVTALLASADAAVTVVVNSIDAPPLRRPGLHAVLAQLAAHPRVSLVCSADTPDFPLLWDVGVRSAFNFAFHDCTTFAPLTVELDVVDDVHDLLGRKARRVNGRDGVAFVLRSLPENAKNLFRLLVGEVLVAMDDDDAAPDDECAGVEYRIVYNKAVEEFICTSEMAFRTLLKEFHDHQIITSRKDAIGTELLSVPFPKDELEAMLEDLVA